jgi:spore coat polysaccharide biosynthesis protein SpsF
MPFKKKSSEEKIIIIIQARLGSTRLPGKVLKTVAGEKLLLRTYERISFSKTADVIIIATSNSEKDDLIEEICKKENIKYYRGSEDDLLERHYKAGIEFGADVVVKIPSDCPLIDYRIIDRVIKFYMDNKNKYDFVSNLHPATYPDGNDVEVIPMNVLKIAYSEAKSKMEREHTTPFIWERPDRFRIGNVEWETGLDYSMTHRFTIDYPEDYDFIKTVYDELYFKDNKFSLDDILKLLIRKPGIKALNEKYAGVNWYRNHLDELKTIKKDQTKII